MVVKILSLYGVYPEEGKVAVVKPLFKEKSLLFLSCGQLQKMEQYISYISTSIGTQY